LEYRVHYAGADDLCCWASERGVVTDLGRGRFRWLKKAPDVGYTYGISLLGAFA
jgi:hypothetical protein